MKYFGLLISILSLALSKQLLGQHIKKYKYKAEGKTFAYYVMQPQTKVNGMLILLPASGEKPHSVFNKTNLPQLLAQNGYLTIIPVIHNTLFADQQTITQLNQIFIDQSQKYVISNFIIGGLSSGGAIAVGYAEWLLAKDTQTILKGVFSIDAPLDLSRIYSSAERKIKYSCQGLIMKEGYSIKNTLDKTLGGSPESNPDQYLKYSSYSANDEDGGSAKFLKNIPIRLYSEPDLDYVRNTYCPDLAFNDINAFDLESLNKFLLRIGNKNSQYIATKGKGFHSWNIVDAVECKDWILRINSLK
jgi:hypothetical protein